MTKIQPDLEAERRKVTLNSWSELFKENRISTTPTIVESGPKSMGKKLAEMSWDSIVILVLAVCGWIYTAGIMSAHVEDARSRLERVEQKLDVLSQDVYKYSQQSK